MLKRIYTVGQWLNNAPFKLSNQNMPKFYPPTIGKGRAIPVTDCEGP
jgi:hypothetical protein